MATDDRIDDAAEDARQHPEGVVPPDLSRDDGVAGGTVPAPAEFEQAPTWLVTADPPAPHSVRAPSRRGRAWVGAGCAVVLLAVTAVAIVVARTGTSATEGAARPVAAQSAPPAASTSSLPSSSAPAVSDPSWCAEVRDPERSVGRGPGGTGTGPDVIRAFDHAYYVERDGARVASLMLEPNPVPDIQKWIDEVPLGTEHCLTVVATSDPYVFAVDLGLRTPGRSDGVIRQRITVAPSPDGFKIARVEDAVG